MTCSIAGSIQFPRAKGAEKSRANHPVIEHIKVPDNPPKCVIPEAEDIIAPPIMLREDPNAPAPVFCPVLDPNIANPVAKATTDETKKVAKKQPFPIIRRVADGLSNGWDYFARLPAQSAWDRLTTGLHK